MEDGRDGPSDGLRRQANGLARSRSVGLLHKLMAAVRPEFRADDLIADTANPMFGPGPCTVKGCDRALTGHGLCSGHRQRWVKAGRPDLAEFVAETDPRWRRHQPNAVCIVNGCGYGSARQGMCALHAQRWERSGRPDLPGWLATTQPVQRPRTDALCRIEHRELWQVRRSATATTTHGAPTAGPTLTSSSPASPRFLSCRCNASGSACWRRS